MSDPVQIALISMIGGSVASIGPIVIAILNLRRNKQYHDATSRSIEVVREDVNGKMAQLLKVTGESEKAKGKVEERAEADQRAKE